MTRFILTFAFVILALQGVSQNRFDPPVTLFYEKTQYTFNGETKQSNYDGIYYLFQFELPNNRTIYEVYSTGQRVSLSEGYIYTGKVGNYDKYTSFSTNFDYWSGRYRSDLQPYAYLLVSNDRKVIMKHLHIRDYNNIDKYEKGDPNNRRKRPTNNTSITPSYTTTLPQTNEKKRRIITCTSCNGTGLEWDYSSALCHLDCSRNRCNKCGDKHCLDHGRHKNCYRCGGTGSINQVDSGRGWRNEW